MTAAVSSKDLYTSTTAQRDAAKEAAKNTDRVTQDQFMKLLLTQMTHQDPLSPMQNEEFISQMAQLQTLEEQTNTNKLLETMGNNSQVAEASGMIGTYVTGLDENLDSVKGIVTHVTVRDGVAKLGLNNGKILPLSGVTQVDIVMGEDQ